MVVVDLKKKEEDRSDWSPFRVTNPVPTAHGRWYTTEACHSIFFTGELHIADTVQTGFFSNPRFIFSSVNLSFFSNRVILGEMRRITFPPSFYLFRVLRQIVVSLQNPIPNTDTSAQSQLQRKATCVWIDRG